MNNFQTFYKCEKGLFSKKIHRQINTVINLMRYESVRPEISNEINFIYTKFNQIQKEEYDRKIQTIRDLRIELNDDKYDNHRSAINKSIDAILTLKFQRSETGEILMIDEDTNLNQLHDLTLWVDSNPKTIKLIYKKLKAFYKFVKRVNRKVIYTDEIGRLEIQLIELMSDLLQNDTYFCKLSNAINEINTFDNISKSFEIIENLNLDIVYQYSDIRDMYDEYNLLYNSLFVNASESNKDCVVDIMKSLNYKFIHQWHFFDNEFYNLTLSTIMKYHNIHRTIYGKYSVLNIAPEIMRLRVNSASCIEITSVGDSEELYTVSGYSLLNFIHIENLAKLKMNLGGE